MSSKRSAMYSTEHTSNTKLTRNVSTVNIVSKSIDNIANSIGSPFPGQQSATILRPISSNAYYGVITGTPPRLTKLSQTSTTPVVSPRKPKVKSRSGAITTHGTSIDCPVLVKLETTLLSTDGESVKSGHKWKTDDKKSQPTNKSVQNVNWHTLISWTWMMPRLLFSNWSLMEKFRPRQLRFWKHTTVISCSCQTESIVQDNWRQQNANYVET